MDFSSVKLKKTATKEPPRPVQLICDGTNYQTLMEETYMEKYYDQIASFTFRSTFVPLPREAAAALVEEHKRWQADRSVTWENNSVLMQLAESIDRAKAELGVPFIFIRLSSRSPKDAPMESPDFINHFNHEMEWVEHDEAGLPPYPHMKENRQLCAIYRATTYAMKLSRAAEGIKLLVMSDRIQGDLQEYSSGRITENFSVVVREFRTFDPDLEFRGFVHNGQFTALTQYNNFAFFPKLLARREEIVRFISEDYRNRIQPKISIPSYVIDFVLCVPREGEYPGRTDRFQNLQIWVVEINPLAEFAGTGMFTWENDRDLLLGRKPFEFRMQTDLTPGVFADLAPEVKLFLNTLPKSS
ncbi:cell division cycle protein 123-like [Pelomyxa schiedti]|nr:cell division cycle protein 123-like [Pelomyxa schiedti]